MSNKEHSSSLRRSSDVAKQRLIEDAFVSDKKKQRRKRRPRFDKYKKSNLELAPEGCHGCNRNSCLHYVLGLEDKKLKGEAYDCHSSKI